MLERGDFGLYSERVIGAGAGATNGAFGTFVLSSSSSSAGYAGDNTLTALPVSTNRSLTHDSYNLTFFGLVKYRSKIK